MWEGHCKENKENKVNRKTKKQKRGKMNRSTGDWNKSDMVTRKNIEFVTGHLKSLSAEFPLDWLAYV